MADMLDCLVIGAGPAGLTAAVYLARFKRRFLVLHDDDPRAIWIPRTHNFPTYPEGITGEELMARMTAQAERYGAEVRLAEVESLRPEDGGFTAGTAAGPVRARTVLLATGVKDAEPALPDMFDAVKRGLLRICPICDAYETSGGAVGVIGNGEKGAREAMFLRTYSDQITLIHVGEPSNLPDDHRRRLREAGIDVIDTPIDEVVVERDRIAAFGFNGVRRTFDTVYSALGSAPRAGLAIQAGAALAEDGCLAVDDHQRTSVPGLYAAGDLVKGLNQITISMAEAAIAATDIHNRLRQEAGQVAP